jgi:hypothetical protein
LDILGYLRTYINDKKLLRKGLATLPNKKDKGQWDKEPWDHCGVFPPPPSSPSMSGATTPSPPSTPPTQDPRCSKPARVLVTPLWKRKSLARKSSSFTSPRIAIKRMSQVSMQTDVQNQAVKSTEPADTIITKPKVSPISMDASPGSKSPNNVTNIVQPLSPYTVSQHYMPV